MDEILRYTDLAHVIQLARANGFNDREIVRVLTGSMTYSEARKIAQRAASPDWTHNEGVHEFKEKRLSLFEFGYESFTVALLQQV
jgi:hypothetical protein